MTVQEPYPAYLVPSREEVFQLSGSPKELDALWKTVSPEKKTPELNAAYSQARSRLARRQTLPPLRSGGRAS